jgi:hypothetical protein
MGGRLIQIRWIAAGTVLLVLAMIITAGVRLQPTAIIQPLPFNHNLHIEQVELECSECHTRAEQSARATLPDIEICQDCHLEAMTETELEANLLTYTNENRAIPWQRIYQVPDHVYFSHRRHVALGKLDCEKCHGNVRQLTEPADKPIINPTMNWCMDCHEESRVSNDCLGCHI